MTEVKLPNGKKTSRLGFGGATLRGGIDTHRSLQLLSAAYEAGFRHFDVAPIYGLGLAEDVLGTFLKGRRNNVTITTKVGLARPPHGSFLSSARKLVRPLFSAIPTIRQSLGNRTYQFARRQITDVAALRTSLEDSLRRLRVEHIDILLLHEYSASLVTESTIEFLSGAKEKGLIGCYGIGSEREDALEIAAHQKNISVIQTNWCLLDPPLVSPAASLLVTHGAMRTREEALARLPSNAEDLRSLSRSCGFDLSKSEIFNDLLLAAALGENPEGVVLVGSSKPHRFERFARIVTHKELVEAGLYLARALLK